MAMTPRDQLLEGLRNPAALGDQRIRSLIGTGGAPTNGIRRELSVEIDVAEDGLVTVYGVGYRFDP